LILVPATVSAQCQGGATRTVTSYNNAGTTTVRSTVVRTTTDGQVVTSVYQTTVVATATCHYPQSGSPSTSNVVLVPIQTGICIGSGCGVFGRGKRRNAQGSDHPPAADKRDVAAFAAVAAVTSTTTQTTRTVTITSQTTLPAQTTTENGENPSYARLTPPD
jgi:hypothetical protein